jgi:hypothetical protein
MISKYKCDAILKDPFYNGKICGSPASWKIKIENSEDYDKFRCGRHTYKYDKIPINEKIKKRIRKNENEEHETHEIFNFEDLLKYIESEDIKNNIPQEINDLYKILDDINSYLIIINK